MVVLTKFNNFDALFAILNIKICLFAYIQGNIGLQKMGLKRSKNWDFLKCVSKKSRISRKIWEEKKTKFWNILKTKKNLYKKRMPFPSSINTITIVLWFWELFIWSKVSTPDCFRIQGEYCKSNTYFVFFFWLTRLQIRKLVVCYES